MRERGPNDIDALYSRAFPARRTGPLYAAFPYPTKISPEAIALFIVAHTDPGQTVFDGFAGSGTTGLAALTCDRPPPELETHARQLGLRANWGPRHAVLYELGVVGSLVARTLTNPPDPLAFRKATNEILSAVIETDGWMYSASFDGTDIGTIRHVV